MKSGYRDKINREDMEGLENDKTRNRKIFQKTYSMGK